MPSIRLEEDVDFKVPLNIRKSSKKNENKENIQSLNTEKEEIKEKEARIQKKAINRVNRQIRTSKKKEQIQIKTK